ncbi:MAG: TIGR02206 family membrane protein [Clostridia bacterium]|nr:TIGR02206 family membrane protein [Clostridia bacterium]
MKEALKQSLDYFFGVGETIEFHNFTLAHFAPIIIAAVLVVLIYRYRDRLRNCKYDRAIRFTLAFAAIVTEMSYFWRLVGVPALNPNPIDHLPITVCGWALIFASYLAVTGSQTLFDFSYFWLFSGTIFALVTPTVISYTGPTRFRYYQFWCEHTLGYLIIFYMIFVHKMRPTIRSAVKALSLLSVLAVIAYITNRLQGPGANYLFLAEPEETPSILDILPPNFALRACVMAAVILTMFALSYLPWYLKDRKAKKTALAAPPEE